MEHDLLKILPKGFDMTDYCVSGRYWRWEKRVAEWFRSMGWFVGEFWSTEYDGFGPLARAVEIASVDGVFRLGYG